MKTIFEKLIKYSFVWPLLMLVCAIGTTAAVIDDWRTIWQMLFVGLFVVAVAAMVVLLVAALFMRRWLIAVAMLVSTLFSLGIAFVLVIILAVGQHHPPRQAVADVLSWNGLYMGIGDEAQELDNTIEKDSWWTDGRHFYQVTKTGSRILMEGGTLHEGGYEVVLTLANDSLRISAPDYGYTPFGADGLYVTRHLLTDSIRDVRMEVLVAHDADDGEPVAVLQRFDGSEQAFEVKAIRTLLAGDYTGGDGTHLTFFDNGTVTIDGKGSPRPYTVEYSYHFPNGVIRLPDGRHISVTRGSGELYIYQATYDADEQTWTCTDKKTAVLNDTTGTDDEWAFRQLFSPTLHTFLDAAPCELHDSVYSHLETEHPIALLNFYLLRQACREWQREEEEESAESIEEMDEERDATNTELHQE